MTAATFNLKSKLVTTSPAANSLPNINDAVFVIGADERVVYGNDRLFQLTRTNETDLLGKSYHQLFQRLSLLCEHDQKTLGSLLAARNYLKESPRQDTRVGNTFGDCIQVEIFRMSNLEEQPFWGGVIRVCPSAQNGASAQTETFRALTDELRSSLVSIIGCATILHKDIDDWNEKKLHGFVDSIVENAQRSAQLLENVRDSWGVEHDGLQLDVQPTDLQRLIQHVLRRFSDKVDLLNLALDIPQTLPYVEMDIIRMDRVMHMLFHNILNTVGGKLVRVYAHQIERHAVQVDICYEGENIFPPTGPDSVNEPLHQFVRKSGLTRELYLQMYVIQSILKAHKGTLCAKTLAEHGTVVHLVLPLKQQLNTPQAATQPTDGRHHTQVRAQLSGPRGKVMVIEDDPYVLRLLGDQLKRAGHSVTNSCEGKHALQMVTTTVPDIILLNWHLAVSGGLDLCAKLRELTAAPIIVIADDFSADELIASLAAGADDYVSWPIQVKEVLARIQARLRRSYLPEAGDDLQRHPVVKVGDLAIDLAERHVTLHGKPVRLTPIEYKLLHALASNAGRILTHGQLISKVWGSMCNDESQYLWVNISRLRTKLKDSSSDPKYILTERGVGYALAQPDEIR